MTSQIKKVALAGATGSLGSVVLQELLDAGFDVTALTRSSSTAKLPPKVKVAKVDYTSLASLKEALEGQDALVSTLGYEAGTGQDILVDAAIDVGVKRLIPSEFGSDTEIPSNRVLPAYKPKVDAQEYVKKKVQGSSTTYTFIITGAFLDWGISHGFFFDTKAKKAELYDGGEHTITATPLNTIARGVVGVLKHLDQTANRTIRIHGAAVTLKGLLKLVQKYTTAEGWQVTEVDTEKLLEKGLENYKTAPQDAAAWVYPLLKRVAFGKGTGNDFSNINDNDLIGVKALNDHEVDKLVKGVLQSD